MKIIADSNLALLEETFARHGDITLIPGRNIRASHVKEADALLLRSVTEVNADLLQGSRLKFVGTATIGTEHLDIKWMERNGISWASAPGCNADAASQYTVAMILLACQRLGRELAKQSVGIIGHGNVGSRLHHLLNAMGVSTVACDPPLADHGEKGLVSFEEAIQQDIVSIHVPLTRHGPYPTWHMINHLNLGWMKPGSLLVNTSRGDVVDGAPLLSFIDDKKIHAALDVWPGEPAIDQRLLAASTVASPHVAGYSVEGKQNGTLMIYKAFCQNFGIEFQPLPGYERNESGIVKESPDRITRLLRKHCDVAADDKAIRSLSDLGREQRAEGFDQLRKSYRLRHDL